MYAGGMLWLTNKLLYNPPDEKRDVFKVHDAAGYLETAALFRLGCTIFDDILCGGTDFGMILHVRPFLNFVVCRLSSVVTSLLRLERSAR